MRKKYASQIKYEKNNPTITFRVKKNEYEQIKQMAQKSGKNISELVRIALLGLEKNVSTTFENGLKIGSDQGYNTGYAKGKKDWAICVYCYKCNKEFYITPLSMQHTYIIEYMLGKLCHQRCPSY